MAKRTYFPDLWAELTASSPLLREAYLLYGPEEYLTRRALDRIMELCGQVRPLDLAELSGTEASLADVAEEISTLPMVAPRRLVIVRQAEKLLAKAQRGGKPTREARQLASTLSEREASWCLVLLASPSISLPSMPGGDIVKAMACYGAYPLPERQLGQWIRREAHERGLRIDGAAVARLVALTGSNLLDLEQELGKLAAYAGGDTEITRSMVDEVADSSAGSLPELLEAVASCDVPRALQALDDVLLLPRNTARALPALVSLFEEIRMAVFLAPDALAGKFPPWRLKEVVSRARGWTAEGVLQAFDDLFKAELAWKSGSARLDTALTAFVVSLGSPGTTARGEGMLNGS
ncbi:DNA polymerase III subunit delta [Candidatus Fermentibacteria bacterium]|nr:DNA polymerase III subunit delta [Candidatus Fermentibacteria bacterium]